MEWRKESTRRWKTKREDERLKKGLFGARFPLLSSDFFSSFNACAAQNLLQCMCCPVSFFSPSCCPFSLFKIFLPIFFFLPKNPPSNLLPLTFSYHFLFLSFSFPPSNLPAAPVLPYPISPTFLKKKKQSLAPWGPQPTRSTIYIEILSQLVELN